MRLSEMFIYYLLSWGWSKEVSVGVVHGLVVELSADRSVVGGFVHRESVFSGYRRATTSRNKRVTWVIRFVIFSLI